MIEESAGVPGSYQYETDSILRQSFAAIAAEDPARAAGMIAGLPEDRRGWAMSGYLTRVFISDPGAAADQCRAWLADPDLSGKLARAWAVSFSWQHGSGIRDPGPVLAAIPELNDAVDDMVLSTWTKADPEAAAGWISDRLAAGKKVTIGREGVFADLATSRPEFTSGWLLTLPDQKLQTQAAETLMANWGAFDPAAAQAWAGDLPPGPVRDAAWQGLEIASGRGPRKGSFSDPFGQ